MKEFLKNGLEPFSYFIYCIAVLINLRRNKSSKTIFLFLYYLLAVICITIACYTEEQVNRVLYNLFFFITICTLSYYFNKVFITRLKKNITIIIFLLHLVIFAHTSLVSHKLYEINNSVYAITYLSIIIYALTYFDQLLRNVSEMNILHNLEFWLASGYLLYFLSCFFIILFYGNAEVDQRGILWSIQNIILFLSAVLTISGSIWINYQQRYYRYPA